MAANQNNPPVQPTTTQQPPAGPQPGAAVHQPLPPPQKDPLRIEPAEIKKMMKSSLFDASYNAYMNTHLEADKTIITVSSAGIGLLTTLSSVVEVNSTFDIFAYKMAISSFICAIVFAVAVFKMNGIKLEKMFNDEIKIGILEQQPQNKQVKWWQLEFDQILSIVDWAMMALFILGILFTAHVGINTYEIKARKAIAEAKKPADPKVMTIDKLQVGSLVVKQVNYSTAKTRRK